MIEGLTRRRFLKTGTGLALTGMMPSIGFGGERQTLDMRLTPAPARYPLVGTGYPETEVWAYNGKLPGPEIRLQQGDWLRLTLENALAQETTVHWHGVRLPNAMDGVAGLTQSAVGPGEAFVYEFELPDAGSFWYHPHFNSSEQIGRGLYGALIVEEPNPLLVDRDETWVIDDWRLTEEAAIADDFGNGHDMSHAGRIGNVISINGELPGSWQVRSGERIRLRLINVSNARNCALRFEGHDPSVIAIDGQPVKPHSPKDGVVLLAAAMRVDLLLDMTQTPSSQTRIIDEFYSRYAYKLIDIVYSDDLPLREQMPDWPVQLPANPLPEPDLDAAERYEIVFAGGAMGGLRGASMNGEWLEMRALAEKGVLWTVNGVARAAGKFDVDPILRLERERSYVLTMRNDTAFPHPMHLHGYAFRVLSRDGHSEPYMPWQDTVLIGSGAEVEIAFKADNPGSWLFHCHVLEHQASGMSGVIEVV